MIVAALLFALGAAQSRPVITSPVAPHPPTIADQAARLRAMGLSASAVDLIQADLRRRSRLPACSEDLARKGLYDLLGAAIAKPFNIGRFEAAARASDSRNNQCKAAQTEASLRLLRSLPPADQPIYAKSMLSF